MVTSLLPSAWHPMPPSSSLPLRMVCTWPTKDKQVCRDFDTGKLVTEDRGQ